MRRLAGKLHSMSPAHVQLLTVPLLPGNFNTPAGNVVKWDPVLAPQLFSDLTLDRPVGGPESGQAAKVTVPPGSICSTPGGRPASCNTRANSITMTGV